MAGAVLASAACAGLHSCLCGAGSHPLLRPPHTPAHADATPPKAPPKAIPPVARPSVQLFGREGDTKDALAWLHKQRAVLLVGPPGVGKSSLGAQILYEAKAAAGAVIDLMGAGTARGVLEALCTGLGLRLEVRRRAVVVLVVL